MKFWIKWIQDLTWRSMVSVPGRSVNLTFEDAVANDRVKQHQWEERRTSPKHEHETGLRRSRLVDRDDERDDVARRKTRGCRMLI